MEGNDRPVPFHIPVISKLYSINKYSTSTQLSLQSPSLPSHPHTRSSPSARSRVHPSCCSALGLLLEASGIMMTFVHFLKKDWIASMIYSMLFSETSGCTGSDNTSSQAFPVSGKALPFCDSLPLYTGLSYNPAG